MSCEKDLRLASPSPKRKRNISLTEAMITNMVPKITQENLLKVLEWLLFITLFIIAIFFMKEVLIQYNSGDTSFKQFESAITEYPTITLCLNDKFLSNYSWYEHTYGIDVNIYYNIDDVWVPLSLEDDTFNNDTKEIIQVR